MQYYFLNNMIFKITYHAEEKNNYYLYQQILISICVQKVVSFKTWDGIVKLQSQKDLKTQGTKFTFREGMWSTISSG